MIPPLSRGGSTPFDSGRLVDSMGWARGDRSWGMARAAGDGNSQQPAGGGGLCSAFLFMEALWRCALEGAAAGTETVRATEASPASPRRMATFQLEQSPALSIMAPLRAVGPGRVHAVRSALPSSRGPGHSPLKAVTRVRIPLGAPILTRFIYGPKRAAILQSFLDRPRIYQTGPTFERFEAKARDNVSRAIQTLIDGSSGT